MQLMHSEARANTECSQSEHSHPFEALHQDGINNDLHLALFF